MLKYRKKPVVIEAVQWTGKNWEEIEQFCTALRHQSLCDKSLVIDTLEGTIVASVGDYVIKGVAGEFYPCKPDIFEKTYEAVEE